MNWNLDVYCKGIECVKQIDIFITCKGKINKFDHIPGFNHCDIYIGNKQMFCKSLTFP